MKITLDELREAIVAAVEEARKKKEREVAPPERQAGYKGHHALQLNKSQGSRSLVKRQGVSNLGPYTAENAIRAFVRATVTEALSRPAVPSSLASALARGKKSR